MENYFWPLFLGDEENIKNDNNIISYHIMSDGIYCKRKVFGNQYIFYKEDNLPDVPKGKDDLAPIKDIKIPSFLLYETMAFFKFVLEHYKSGMEAYVLYAINPDGKYFLYVPEQSVGAASVHYDISDFHKEYPGCYIVADAHSHSTFGAFWSGTDTNDDCRGRYSVVIGHNQRVLPEIKCRFNYGKKYIDLTVDDLFADNTNYTDDEYDFEELIKKLTEEREVVVSSSPFFGVGTVVIGSEYMADTDDYYANYYAAMHENRAREQHSNVNKSGGVGRCNGCGKFVSLDLLQKYTTEYLCAKCAKKVGAFHVCN
jgi:hypothetical protein